VRGQAHQGRRVSCSQVDGMEASVVGVRLQNAESTESLATSRRKRGVYTTCHSGLPRLKLQCGHSNGHRQLLDTAPRHEDRVSGRSCSSTTAWAILRESRTLEPQLCIDLQTRCCVQLGCVVNRALTVAPFDTKR
jgi:hypothetical protein